MKFVVAAGILAQTIPVISEKAADLITGNDQLTLDLAGLLSSVPREADGSFSKRQRKLNKQPRRRAQGKYPVNAKRIDGALVNQPVLESKPCDPRSRDPDVGILSCGKGRVCQESPDTVFGGNCVPRETPEGNLFGNSKVFKSFGKGGILKNVREAATLATLGTVECVPSDAADVGILSCEEGEKCVPSVLSSMGGFCSNADSRRLYHLTENAGICDPSSPDYMYYNCDCSTFDNKTGTGTIPCTIFEGYCLGLVYPGCAETCATRTVDYTFSNFTAPGYSFCFEFAAPYAQKVCFEEDFEADTCAITFNGQPCAKCEIKPFGNYTSITFNCTNAGGKAGNTSSSLLDLIPIVGSCYNPAANVTDCYLCPDAGTIFDTANYDTEVAIDGLGSFTCYDLFSNAYYFQTITADYCPAVVAAASSACCNYVCDLCGPYNYIPAANYDVALNVPVAGYEGATCGDLANAAYFNYSIGQDTCASAAGLAASTCCEAYTPQCQLCSGELANPYLNVTLGGYELPCYFLEAFVNETECATIKPLAQDCCESKSATGSDVTPSEDGAVSLLSTRNVLTMVGAAAATMALALN